MAINRWGVDIKRGLWVEAHHPRGGKIFGKVEKISTMEGYGKEATLSTGHSISVDDVRQVFKFPDTYVTTYCNHPHRVNDGKPVAHECYVLPPDALRAEVCGQFDTAIAMLRAAKPFRTHKGLKSE